MKDWFAALVPRVVRRQRWRARGRGGRRIPSCGGSRSRSHAVPSVISVGEHTVAVTVGELQYTAQDVVVGGGGKQ